MFFGRLLPIAPGFAPDFIFFSFRYHYYLVKEDVDFEKEDVILLTSKEVLSKFNEFL